MKRVGPRASERSLNMAAVAAYISRNRHGRSSYMTGAAERGFPHPPSLILGRVFTGRRAPV